MTSLKNTKKSSRTEMKTIKVNGKEYRYDYFNKCELCDMRGEDGECKLPDEIECGFTDIFKAIGE